MRAWHISILALLWACGRQTAPLEAPKEFTSTNASNICSLISTSGENTVWSCNFDGMTCKTWMSGETVYAVGDCVKSGVGL